MLQVLVDGFVTDDASELMHEEGDRLLLTPPPSPTTTTTEKQCIQSNFVASAGLKKGRKGAKEEQCVR